MAVETEKTLLKIKRYKGLFNEEKFQEIKDTDPLIAIQDLCDELRKFIDLLLANNKITNTNYMYVVQDYSFIHSLYVFSTKRNDFAFAPSGNIINDLKIIKDNLTKLKITSAKLFFTNISTQASERYSDLFNGESIYEFSDDEFEILQKKINEIRDFTKKAQSIEENHKNRLLKMIEKLQSELHKNMSDLSRFYGVFVEFGVVLGKFGEESKPMFDRISDIIKIVSGVQTKANDVEPKLISKIFSNNVLEEGKE